MNAQFAWRLYAIGLGILILVMYVTVMLASFRSVYLLDLAITSVAYIGLCGYAFQRKIGARRFWQVLWLAFVGWELLFNFVLSARSLREVGLATVVILMAVILVPEYIALWLYGFRSFEIWDSTT